MTISLTPVTDLAAAVAGPVLTPGHPDYPAEVAGFNLSVAAAPAVVVGATGAADIATAVTWAADAGLPITVQANGHGLTGDLAGTLLISTRRLTAVTVDPVAATATVGAGARWRAVIDAAAPHGLAPLNGSSSSVGAVGYTLGGGLGPLARRFGLAADRVRALTLVTGDGEIRRVDAEHDPDLFWAIRGGKVGFGIVVDMTIDLVPVRRLVGGGLFFPGEAAAAVLHGWRRWAPALPVEAGTSIALLRLPPDPSLPPPLQGRFVVHLRFAHLGTPAEAAELLAPMRDIAPVLADTVGDLPYPAIDAVHMDPTTPLPAYDHGVGLTALPPEAVDALVAVAGAESGSGVTMVELRLLGGAVAAPVADTAPSAAPGRSAAFQAYVLGVPAGPAAALIPAQVEAVVGALAPWRTAGGPNFLGMGGAGAAGGLWPADQRARLAAVARRYDPQDLFGGATRFGG
ncbi:FAD-binding oxidoreductase [Nakamurella sp.]|uniref:FAD-binding oxidoreductase n=1 Tax=Nakamurella sp. TaxID=1869182 RepID=UPI003B3B29F9